ncbi:MAG: hypothetical protein VYA55_13210 [Pseudomonadota bacterium]|nr:hypothetical protein [Pseudomonadota bacterium]
MKIKQWLQAILLWCGLGALLSGCDQWAVTPADISGQPIIGHWYLEQTTQEGEDRFYQRLYLHVREDGRVLYANRLCRNVGAAGASSHSELILDYMAIKRITTQKMVLQQYPLTPKFELRLGQWPDQGEGVFEVDNLVLQPIAATSAPDFRSWSCP